MTHLPWASGPLQTLLGLRHPIVQGPFGGGPSSVALAAAVSDAGGLGSFGAHALAPGRIRELVGELRSATPGPFSVNLWVPQPGEDDVPDDSDLARYVDRLRPYLDELELPVPAYRPGSGPRYDDQVAALLEAEPPAISFVMGVPSSGVVAEARRRGIVTIGTATTVDEAVAVERAGLDAVVASGSDAGGHRGAFLRPVEESLVGTFSLVPQVADAVSIAVIAAGGVADARGLVAALVLGAHGVQIGTAFLATDESAASSAHKAALHTDDARRTVLTRVFSGRTARGIPNRFVRDLTAYQDDIPPYPVQNVFTSAIRAAANDRGIPDLVHLWAGQGAPLTKARSAADLYAELVTDVEALLNR